MAENNINKHTVTEFGKGLSTDTSPQNQPQGTQRFVLNGINESEVGDMFFPGPEQSNAVLSLIPEGYIPIGNIYMVDGQIAMCLVAADEASSIIGILDTKGKRFITYVDDSTSTERDKLNFKVTKPIDMSYRLRRGCENTIYFTDDNTRPKYFNFNSIDDFKNNDGITWNSSLFNLQKQYKDIPVFAKAEVLDTGGAIEPGGVNVVVQYVDAGLNPTEWITSSPVIKIYNDSLDKDFRDINGSINSDAEYLNFPVTSKAIRIELSELDQDFLYYRLAFVESNQGTGEITSVKYTDVIPTSKDFFIYTGLNAPYNGTLEEISAFTDIIYKAKNIEQIENILTLTNTAGSPVNFCALQKYASRIKADCVTKTVLLNNLIDPSNPKNPTQEFGGTGYMPGEIYSFGIVYVFEGGALSPVYHIPGKSSIVGPNTTYTTGSNVYPMSNTDNQGVSVYTGNESCGSSSYWGLDSEGETLEDKYVRHHRFPLRSEIDLPLMEVYEEGDIQEITYYQVGLTLSGILITPIECAEDDAGCTPQSAYPFSVKVHYTVDGQESSFVTQVNPAVYADNTGSYDVSIYKKSPIHTTSNLIVTSLEVSDINGNYIALNGSTDMSDYFVSDFAYSTNVEESSHTVQERTYKTEMLGISFSGIDLPKPEDSNGENIIGYYIVRNERTEFEKTILDSAVLTPTVYNSKYVSFGLLQPETNRIQEDIFGVIHPEHKFNDKHYSDFDELIHEGTFKTTDTKYGKITFNDVFEGSSYNSEKQKDGNDDGDKLDGWSIDIISRDNIVEYETGGNFTIPKANVKESFYLDALESRTINDSATDVYNIAADNKTGILQIQNQIITNRDFPYVIMKKNALDPYSNFRVLPYYKESLNYHEFGKDTDNSASIFNGDSYVTPMRYVNTMFYDNRVAKRVGKSNALTIILGAIIAVIGVVVTIFTAGAGAPIIYVGAALALAGTGVLILSSGIKAENANRAYLEEYNKGLRETVMDKWVETFYTYIWEPISGTSFSRMWNYIPPGPPFNAPYSGQYRHPSLSNSNWGQDGPSDDTIQWVGEAVTDLWFESSVNMSLRNHMTTDLPTHLHAPGRVESGNNSLINVWEFYGKRDWGANYTSSVTRHPVSSLERHLAKKLLIFDGERVDSRYYYGTALAEWYHLNPDYTRKNKEKTFFHLPLEYDCCTECMEDFSLRIHYSEQSFQEELTDNFRVFLPNNYIDIQGETGEIMNTFKIGYNLFVHTQEALYIMPRGTQERITDQIVSFIGSGEYFGQPPRKILDDDTGGSAGTNHKWGAIKTPQGYFFVCENQKKIFKFDGQKLQNISDIGESKWFTQNIPLQANLDSYENSYKRYDFDDNPTNPVGIGYIATYDSENERVIFTKKDFIFNEEVLEAKNLVCYSDYDLNIFEKYETIIQNEEKGGWDFVAAEDCNLIFKQDIEYFRQETRIIDGREHVQYIKAIETIHKSIPSERPGVESIEANNSWTKSYSLKHNNWISYHSYLPSLYMNTSEAFFSWIPEGNAIWKHNVHNNFQSYYGDKYPFIIEFISLDNPLVNNVTDNLTVYSQAKVYDNNLKDYVSKDNIFFNKAIIYNSRQCSGELELIVKNEYDNSTADNYLMDQVDNLDTMKVLVDNNEGIWSLNMLRDIRVNYDTPIFNSNVLALQDDYFIDKVLNTSSLDPDKDWTELEPFKDSYLAVRLIFDNFVNAKLLMNYNIENSTQSFR